MQNYDTVVVAAIQCSSIMGDIDQNTTKIVRLCEEAASNG